MQRLSGLDASFLYLETATQPLHVCSILEIDTSTMPGGYTFDRMRDELSLRIKSMPQFREKLADSRFNLDHPVWVDDKDFDVDRHLHRIGLPAPGVRKSTQRGFQLLRPRWDNGNVRRTRGPEWATRIDPTIHEGQRCLSRLFTVLPM